MVSSLLSSGEMRMTRRRRHHTMQQQTKKRNATPNTEPRMAPSCAGVREGGVAVSGRKDWSVESGAGSGVGEMGGPPKVTTVVIVV
jgi:hypothetical protein